MKKDACPKCKKETVISGECSNCGIIVDKYKKRLEQSVIAPGADSAQDSVIASVRDLAFIRAAIAFHQSVTARVAAVRRRVNRTVDFVEAKTGINLVVLFSTAGQRTSSWFRDVRDRLATLGVYLVVACFFSTFLLSAAKMLWHVYLQTAVGQGFVLHFPENYRLISGLMGMNHFLLSAKLCLIAAQACLILAVASWGLLIMPLLYEGRGIFMRYLFWPAAGAALGAAPSTVLGDWMSVAAYDWTYGWAYDLTIQQQGGLLLVPAIIVCVPCFELIKRALPELNVVPMVKRSKVGLVKGWQMASMYLEKWR